MEHQNPAAMSIIIERLAQLGAALDYLPDQIDAIGRLQPHWCSKPVRAPWLPLGSITDGTTVRRDAGTPLRHGGTLSGIFLAGGPAPRPHHVRDSYGVRPAGGRSA